MNDYIQANLVLITNSCGFPPVTEKHIHANNWRRLARTMQTVRKYPHLYRVIYVHISKLGNRRDQIGTHDE